MCQLKRRDDRRDSGRKAGRHWIGDVLNQITEPGQTHGNQRRPARSRCKESGEPVLGHDRRQDDDEGSGRPRDLELATALQATTAPATIAVKTMRSDDADRDSEHHREWQATMPRRTPPSIGS